MPSFRSSVHARPAMTPSVLPILLAAAVALVAGCASSPKSVRHNEGPIRAATFNFVKDANQGVPGYADARSAMHASIQSAISTNLAAKGVQRVDSGGDVTVAYLVIVGNNVSTAMINDYFGYGRDASKLQETATEAYTKVKNPNFFEAGTLVIDVIGGTGYKLLYREYAARPLLRNASAEVRHAHIQEAVDAVLQKLQVTH